MNTHETYDLTVIEDALSRVDPDRFEKFASAFYAIKIGARYKRLGGMHDGGADGVIYSKSGTPDEFMQASISEYTARKIRDTVKRLREYGREVLVLYYATNQKVSDIDKLEYKLSEELSCKIIIYDIKYFVDHINVHSGTVQAYKSHVHYAASSLDKFGGANTIEYVKDLPLKNLCVFLSQELDRQRGENDLAVSITDTLILWALEGTDPDKNIFRTTKEIEERISGIMPGVEKFFKGELENRLKILTKKTEGKRKAQIHQHKKGGSYCLPYETRLRILNENIEDKSTRDDVSDVFYKRAEKFIKNISVPEDEKDILINKCVEICHAVINRAFYTQGLEMASSSANNEYSSTNIKPILFLIDVIIKERSDISGDIAVDIKNLCLDILNGTFLNSDPKERRYLRKLSHTYIVLFMLKYEPKIVEFFRTMTSNFNLYIGSDLLVICLSEHMLEKGSKSTTNALKLLKSAGSQLILTEKTLDEVAHHIIHANREFINNYQPLEKYLTREIAQEIDVILVRSYFQYKFTQKEKGESHLSWSQYLGQFILSTKIVSKNNITDDLRAYLLDAFELSFQNEKDIDDDDEEVDKLSDKIHDMKVKAGKLKLSRDESNEKALSNNAARMIIRIYRRREHDNDRKRENPYGFRTWWLTERTLVHGAIKDLVEKKGACLMTPEFALHFLQSIPLDTEVQRVYDELLPSILGLQLGKRIDSGALEKFISEINQAELLDNKSIAKIKVAKLISDIQSLKMSPTYK